jgi:hypothetical protein
MAAVDAPTTIIDPNATFTEKPVEDRALSVGTAVCTGEVLDRIREEGGIMEATTPGLFMMPEGDKEYRTFIEMLRDQPPLPDPVFKPGDILPTIEDAGFPLDQMDEYDTEFKKLIEEMFDDVKGFQKITKDEIAARIRQNGLSDSKQDESNGRSPDCVASREQTVYTSSETDTTVHSSMPETTASVVVPTLEDASIGSSGKGHELDSWAIVVA